MLDLYERQRRVGLAADNCMIVPLTQETLAEALGLSTVHMNRVLQQLRRDGLLALGDGRVRLPSPGALAQAAMRD
jgi:CRP-like cAMP-binding protein